MEDSQLVSSVYSSDVYPSFPIGFSRGARLSANGHLTVTMYDFRKGAVPEESAEKQERFGPIREMIVVKDPEEPFMDMGELHRLTGGNMGMITDIIDRFDSRLKEAVERHERGALRL